MPIITLEQLTSTDINSVIQELDREINGYRNAFHLASEKAKKDGNISAYEVYSLFNAISSIHLRPENKTEPLGPMFIGKSERSAIPDDFDNETIQALSDYVEEINDPELKSRIADIVWLRLRNPIMAEIAIKSYLDSALLLEDPNHCVNTSPKLSHSTG